MPFYFRKSFGRGPLRLNLSKSGLGMSVGIKGFRLGTGPRGTYVRAGRGGVYYQKYLSTVPAQPGALSIPASVPGVIPSAPAGEIVEFIGDAAATDDEFTRDANRRLNTPRYSGLWYVVAAMIFLIALFSGGQGWMLPVFLVLVSAGALILAVRRQSVETAERKVVVTYDLDQGVQEAYADLTATLGQAANCCSIWRVTTIAANSMSKYHAGADTLIQRSPTTVIQSSPIETNVMIFGISLGQATCYFFPDRVLILVRNSLKSLRYPDIRIEASQTSFREEGLVPQDAKQIATTWQFVNKNGDPDRRFNNNRVLPVLLYSALSIVHSNFACRLQFSRSDVAQPIASAISKMQGVYSTAKLSTG